MKKLILAGACSVYGLSELKTAFLEKGYETLFVDAPFMAGIKIHEYEETENILYTQELPVCDVVIPLSEFWISYCIKNNYGNISQNALKASRSKSFLYSFMKENHFDYPEIYESKEEAKKALEMGKRIIVKPVGLHSGYGIEILDKSRGNLLDKYFEQALNIKNRTMRIMEIQNLGAMITEAVEGTEYSADCFWNKGVFSVVRICRKRIEVINDKPCVTVYRLMKGDEKEYGFCRESLEKWTSALFDKNDLSFAQFDFIIEEDSKRIVPIDFASRVGGGISDLLIETGRNLYASAVRNEVYDVAETYTQINYLPVVSGYIKNDDYNLFPGRNRIFKKKGDYVISNPSSVGSRVALTVVKGSFEMTEDLFKKQFLDEQYISRDNKKGSI